MKVLVTGATGFIGRHLVKKLAKDKRYEIFCLLRNLKKAKLLESLDIEIISGDITDKQFLEKLNGYSFDLIFHCAACVENSNPEKLKTVNVEGTRNICELALNQGVSRLIYLSSVAVVSGNKEVPLIEDLPLAATNPYGESKLEAEKVVWEYRDKGLPVVILRPPMVYGEDEPHMLTILLKLLKWRILPLVNQGMSKLHLVYIENVVSGMIFCLDKPECLKGSFFIADKEVLTTGEIFDIFARAVKAKPPFRLPKSIETMLLSLPWAGKKFKFFLKNRVYSTDKIESLGFKIPYPARVNLLTSAEKLYHAE
ncbi:MAG: NAD(P)-dependent oxidoreductase [Candidatus Omnitrophica bacterium]|nr:NAD(P)-dependent oxidoreductase [Candidatus Omnitrophota bacterium]